MAYTPVGPLTGGGDGGAFSGGVYVLALPAGAAAGDLVVIQATGFSATATATVTSGSSQTWTVQSGPDAGPSGANVTSYLWSATLQAGDIGASITVTWSASVTGLATGMEYPPGSVHAVAHSNAAAGGTTITGASVAAAAGDALSLLASAKKNSGVTPPTITVPSGYTLDKSAVTGGGGTNFATTTGHKQITTAGTPGADAFTFSTTTNGATSYTVSLTPAGSVIPPTANAGTDQFGVAAAATVTLSASGSTAGSAAISTYAWAQTGGTAVTLSGTGAGRTFTAPTGASSVSLTFQVTVTAADGGVGTDTVVVGVVGTGGAGFVPVGALTGGGDGAAFSGGVYTLTLPSGAAVGDLVVVQATAFSGTATATIASGSAQVWTKASGPDAGGTGTSTTSYLWSAVLQSADLGAGVVVTWSAAVTGLATGVEYPPGSVRATASTVAVGGGSSITGAGVTVFVGDSLMLFGSVKKNSGATVPTITMPAGYTQDKVAVTTGAATNFGTTFGHKTIASAGTAGADTFTFSTSANGATTYTVALAPKSSIVNPTAYAGPDQAGIEPGATVTITATGSLPGSSAITGYSWAQTSGDVTVTLSGSGISRTFTAPGSMDGLPLIFRVTATAADGGTGTDDVVVNILNSTEFIRSAGAWVPQRVSTRAAGAWV